MALPFAHLFTDIFLPRTRIDAPPLQPRLIDFVAPDSLEIAKDHAVIEGQQVATIAMVTTPPSADAQWLSDISSRTEPCDFALHIKPQSTNETHRRLRAKLTVLEGARRTAEQDGILPDPARGEAIDQITELRQRLEGSEGVFSVSLYATTYASTARELHTQLETIESDFARHQATTKRPIFRTLDALQSTLPSGKDYVGASFDLDGQSLSSMQLFSPRNLHIENGMWLGLNRLTGEFVGFDPFNINFDNFNCCVVGKSGGGKGVTLKEIVLRSLPRGIHHIVIDPANEYISLARAVEGQVIHLSPGSAECINPFDLPTTRDKASHENILSNHIEVLQGLLTLLLSGKHGTLSEVEKSSLDAALAATYARFGITADQETHNRIPPTLADLKQELDSAGDPFQLGLRLARYCTGALRGLFDGPTTITLNNPLTVFAIRDLSEDLWPAAMYLISQHTWRQAFTGDCIPRLITVDECHRLFLESSGAGDALLNRLIREGRKYYLGTCTASQDPDDYLHTKGGRASIANANTIILLKQNEGSLTALKKVIDISEREAQYLTGCTKGQGLLITQDPKYPSEKVRVPLRIVMSPSHERYIRTDGFAPASS